MILQCPACSTRYLVPDTAIGVEGRQVRCANCKHSWFAEGPQLTPAAPEPEPAAAEPERAAAAPAEAPAPTTEPVQHEFPSNPPPAPEPMREEPTAGRRIRDFVHSADGEDTDPFGYEPPFKPRRNPAKIWTAVAIGLFLLLGSAAAAVYWFGPPSFLSGLGLGESTSDSALDVQLVRAPERRTLASGHELLSISGRIVNMTDEEQRVPDIRAELRNAQGAVVYDWTIQAPQRTLPPREMVEFNSAEIDIPRNAEELNLKFVPFDGAS